MAADRLSAELAGLTDPWQPAVLRLIQLTAGAGRGGRQAGRRLRRGRGRPDVGCVLVGLGISSLSMARTALSAVGVQLGQVTLAQCQEAAQAALDAPDPPAGRVAVREILAGG